MHYDTAKIHEIMYFKNAPWYLIHIHTLIKKKYIHIEVTRTLIVHSHNLVHWEFHIKIGINFTQN